MFITPEGNQALSGQRARISVPCLKGPMEHLAIN